MRGPEKIWHHMLVNLPNSPLTGALHQKQIDKTKNLPYKANSNEK